MNSIRARENLDLLCKKYFMQQDIKIDVVDVVEDFKTALIYKIFITPALLILKPEPKVTIYGNLDDTEKLVSVLKSKMVVKE